jgi:hypothetical protein
VVAEAPGVECALRQLMVWWERQRKADSCSSGVLQRRETGVHYAARGVRVGSVVPGIATGGLR